MSAHAGEARNLTRFASFLWMLRAGPNPVRQAVEHRLAPVGAVRQECETGREGVLCVGADHPGTVGTIATLPAWNEENRSHYRY